MNQLNWQPSDGGERAEANGFEYEIYPYGGGMYRCDVKFAKHHDPLHHSDYSLELLKGYCQHHANAITAAIESDPVRKKLVFAIEHSFQTSHENKLAAQEALALAAAIGDYDDPQR
jgi:hypothetical protein